MPPLVTRWVISVISGVRNSASHAQVDITAAQTRRTIAPFVVPRLILPSVVSS